MWDLLSGYYCSCFRHLDFLLQAIDLPHTVTWLYHHLILAAFIWLDTKHTGIGQLLQEYLIVFLPLFHLCKTFTSFNPSPFSPALILTTGSSSKAICCPSFCFSFCLYRMCNTKYSPHHIHTEIKQICKELLYSTFKPDKVNSRLTLSKSNTVALVVRKSVKKQSCSKTKYKQRCIVIVAEPLYSASSVMS